MTGEGIFWLPDGEGQELVAMTAAGFLSEDLLQDLVARHPDLLAGGEMEPGAPRRWLLLTREMGVPRRDGGGDHFAVDHLLVDQDAIPTVVEVKRSSDTRIRREVVGQMLDYAANGSRYWTAADLRRRLEMTLGPDADQAQSVLEQLTGEPSVDTDEFLARVEANLRAGRVRLVFVADVVPDELAAIVEFLNAQMSPADVFAVEIRQYIGGQGRALVPRVVGRTAAAAARKSGTSGGSPARSYEETLSRSQEPAQALDARLVTLAGELGLTVRETRTARQLVLGSRTVAQYYSEWAGGGTFEVNVGALVTAGDPDAARGVHDAMAAITRAASEATGTGSPRALPPKVPWLTTDEVTQRWPDVVALLRDVVLPAWERLSPGPKG